MSDFKVVKDPHEQRFNKRIELHAQITEQGIRAGFMRLGPALRRDAKQAIIKGPKTGRLYRIPGRKRRHRASRAGQAPANLTGKLQRSVGFQVMGYDEMEFGYRQNYGAFLELGTSKMDPRPNLKTVVKQNERNATAYFEQGIENAHESS